MRVLVECFTDENVVRGLGLVKADVRRMKGKGNVLNFLKQDPRIAHTGLVDKDARSLNAAPIEPFVLVEKRHDAALYTWRSHRLVVVEDNIEDWLSKALTTSKLDFKQFGLPHTAGQLNKLEPQVGDARVLKLMQQLIEARSPYVATLKKFLAIP